jgi:hypothetical protein
MSPPRQEVFIVVLATILLAAALIVISVVTSLIASSQRKTAAARFGKRFGLEVPAELEPTIRAGIEARRIGSPIGTAIGVTIATVLLLLGPGLNLLATWWCLFGSYLVGLTLGSTTAILIAEQRRDRGSVRVARPSAVSVKDYVSPLQTGFARFVVALAVLVFAADCWLAVSVSPHYLSLVSGILAALGVATLVTYEVIAHRLVSRGALAGTPLELAWDDGLRSYALTNLGSTVGLIPLYSLIAYDTLLLNTTGIASNAFFTVFVGFLPIAATVGILTFILLTTRIHARQHFLRRLWPQLAAKVDNNVAGTYTSVMGGR